MKIERNRWGQDRPLHTSHLLILAPMSELKLEPYTLRFPLAPHKSHHNTGVCPWTGDITCDTYSMRLLAGHPGAVDEAEGPAMQLSDVGM